MKCRFVVLLVTISFLLSCTNISLQPQIKHNPLYKLPYWSFSGRMAYADLTQSFSASINWQHKPKKDQIELTFPFGQGRVLIILTKSGIVFDFGNKRLEYTKNHNLQIAKKIGTDVPILALRYWVLGLIEPKTNYTDFSDGFLQSGWRVKYQQMQVIGGQKYPKKIKAETANAKLKLLINKWQFDRQ